MTFNIRSAFHLRNVDQPSGRPTSDPTTSIPEGGPSKSANVLPALTRPLRSLHNARIRNRIPLNDDVQTRVTKARIARARDVFRTLIDESSNSKPHLESNETWVTDLLDRMKAGNHLVQNGAEYVSRDGLDTDHIYTRWNELSGDTIQAARDAKNLFPSLDIVVPGYRGRKPDERRRVKQLKASDAIVLAEGDLHAPHQIIEALHHLRSGKVKNTPLVVSEPVLEFYGPLWEGLFGPVPQATTASAFYKKQLQQWIRGGKHSDPNAVVLTPKSLYDIFDSDIKAAQHASPPSAIASALQSVRRMDPFAIETEQLVIPQLYIGTTKEDKAEHWRASINGKDVDVRLLMEGIDILGEPEERHGTYMANARGTVADELARHAKFARYPWAFAWLSKRAHPQAAPSEHIVNSGKAQSYIETIQQVLQGQHRDLSRDAFLQRLKSQGVDVARGDKLFFMSDDRGFEVPEWDKIEPYFDEKTKQAALALIAEKVGGQDTKLQAVPGVESTWWINAAGGVEQLMKHFADAFDAYEQATGEKLSRKTTSVVAASLVGMDLATGKAQVRNFTGASTYEIRRPEQGKRADTTECWFVPTENNPGGYSIQQFMDGEPGVPDFEALLPWVKAGRAMEAAGLVFHNARGKERVDDYRIDFVGEADVARGHALQQQVDDYVAHGLRATPNKGGSAQGKSGVQRPLHTPYRDMFVSSSFDPYDILERVDRSDAIVFDSAPSSKAGQAKLFYDYFSALVFKSLHPDYAGMQVLVNANDPQLKILGDLVDVQHTYGLSQELVTMAKPYRNKQDAMRLLQRHWNGYERVRLSDGPAQAEGKFDLDGALARGRESAPPSVVVLASGKAEQPGLVGEAKAVAEWIAQSGFDARTGGGAKGLMGAVTKHFKAANRDLGNDGRIAGVSTDMVIGKETAKNELPKDLDVPYVTRDIVSRMALLFGADMGVFLAGGIGTAQEIGFAIALKAAGHPLTKDKPMVLINSLMPDGRRLADGYMEFFGAADPSLTTRAERIAKGRQILGDMGVHVIEAGAGDVDETVKQASTRIAEASGIRSRRVQGDPTAATSATSAADAEAETA